MNVLACVLILVSLSTTAVPTAAAAPPTERKLPPTGWLLFQFEQPPSQEFWDALSARISAQPVEGTFWQTGRLADWSGETRGRVVTVKVRGTCAIPSDYVPWRSAPLGWIDVVDGEILSFIHVDCKRIGEALSRAKGATFTSAIDAVLRHELTHLLRGSMQHDDDSGFHPALGRDELMHGDDHADRNKPVN